MRIICGYLAITCLIHVGVSQEFSLPTQSQESLWRIRWCTTSFAEYDKCTNLKAAVYSNFIKGTVNLKPLLDCVEKFGEYQCMEAIENDEADVMSLDAGEVMSAGKWHSVIPIAVEEYGGKVTRDATVVVRRTMEIKSLRDLRNKQLCSPGVTKMAGWIIPMIELLQRSEEIVESTDALKMKIVDCNNWIKTASQFFGPSCVPGILNFRHNPTSDNPDYLCKKCKGSWEAPDRCTGSDPYAGNDGVLNCMVHGVGDVGFMSSDTALKLPPPVATNFEFLCPDGSVNPLTSEGMCSWGSHAADAFVTSSAKTPEEITYLQEYIQKLIHETPKIFSERFSLSGERIFNGTDLMWSESVTGSRSLPEKEQQFLNYLGPDLSEFLTEAKICPVEKVRMCVVCYDEFKKCLELRTKLASKNLLPKLLCVLASNHWDCMKRVLDDEADIMMADASDAYLAGNLYELIPFMAEVYDLPFSYAVAVAKRLDRSSSLLDLRGLRTCHGSIYSAAGWSLPISFLITQNRVRTPADCHDLTFQISQIFQKACAPGALNTAHYQSVLHPENLCDLCMGDINGYCSRTPAEPYYGSTGAFKCLAEGGGQVAFVTHLTPWENTDGRNLRIWARALVSQDYELLCADGTRAPIRDYLKCNLGKVPANVLMTASRKSELEVEAYTVLFQYAQQFFGRRKEDTGLFYSNSYLHQDLIFRDSTTRLVKIDSENRTIDKYLGDDFLSVVQRAQCAGASRLQVVFAHLMTMLLTPIIVF